MVITGISRLAVVVVFLAASRVSAQTVILPDQAPAFDTATVVTQAGSETTIAGGSVSGANLFHSFTRFDLANGDIAQWVRGAPNAASIANVINRVTGGTASEINGTLRVSDMANADFWFINPAGVFFGEGAAIDVPGAAYFSTAHELRFADDSRFSTITPDGSTFSNAPPQAFGFLGGQGDIGITAATAGFASDSTDLALSANAVSIQGEFDAGSLEVIALGDSARNVAISAATSVVGTGAIRFDPGTSLLAGGYRLAASEITLNDASLGASTDPVRNGNIALTADTISLQDARLVARADGRLDAGNITLAASSIDVLDSAVDADTGAIDITAESLLADGGVIRTFTTGALNAGIINIVAGDVEIIGGTFLVADTFGSGDVDGISITADRLSVSASVFGSSTFEAGNSGLVNLSATDIAFTDGAFVFSQTEAGSTGNAAGLVIEAETVQIDASTISTRAFPNSTGQAGSIRIDTRSLTANDALLAASTFGSGNSGSIGIGANTIALSGGTVFSAQAGNGSTGQAGAIELDAGVLTMDGGRFTTSAFGPGDGGLIRIAADEIALQNQAFVASQSNVGATGRAGNIEIAAGSLVLDGALVATSTFSGGDAGQLSIVADTATLSNEASVVSDTNPGATGQGGNVTIDVGALQIDGSRVTSSTFSAGNAGTLRVTADDIALTNGARIGSQAERGSTGSAGSVFVDAQSLSLDRANLSSSTFAQGDGGLVDVRAGALTLLNDTVFGSQANVGSTGQAGEVIVNADAIIIDGSRISSSSSGSGDAGSVQVTADSITMTFAGKIISRTEFGGTGNAGAVAVTARELDLREFASIGSISGGPGTGGVLEVFADIITLENRASLSTLALSDGDGGIVRIRGLPDSDRKPDITLDVFSTIASFTQEGLGDAGLIDIEAGNITLLGGSSINSEARLLAQGDAGFILIEADAIRLDDESAITTATEGAGLAGGIDIQADAVLVTGASAITSETLGTSASGSVTLEAAMVDLREGGVISTNSSGGPAGDIILLFPEDGRLVLAGETPGTITTSSGPNTGGRITIGDPFAILSDGGEILALGEAAGANVRIISEYFVRSADRINAISVAGDLVLDSQFSDLSAGTEAPNIDFLDASDVLSGQCAAARSGRTSRFSSHITGPYVPDLSEPELPDMPLDTQISLNRVNGRCSSGS